MFTWAVPSLNGGKNVDPVFINNVPMIRNATTQTATMRST